MEQLTFASLGLVKTLASISEKGFEEPTPVQAQTIPLLLSGKNDVCAQAQTGTGKTAAFALPLIETLEPRAGHVQALILAPTRELALQVCDEFLSLAPGSGLSVAPVYGGQSMSEQLRRLSRGVDIVVGTPGRVMDHMRRGSLKLDKVKYLILDEADEMLDRGFIEDIETVLESVNPERRMLLFSATMSARIKQIAQKYMRDMTMVKTISSETTTKLTKQIYMDIEERDRFEALCRVIDMEDDFYGLVFCRTKIDVDTLASKLSKRGYSADALHGDITQPQREKILGKIKNRQTNILVATDVAARGIDITGLTHVINFSLPQNPESYIHRIGRTGRAGSEGTAITFISHSEFRKLSFIKQISGSDIRREDLPEIHEIIGAKKNRLRKQLEDAIASGKHKSYTEAAHKLAEEVDPIDALAAVLSIAFGSQFDVSQYGEIKKRGPREERSRDGAPRREEGGSSARVVMLAGRTQGMTPNKLVKLIKSAVDLPDSHINAVRIETHQSYATLPRAEAEMLVKQAREEDPSAPLFTITEGVVGSSEGRERKPFRERSSAPRREGFKREAPRSEFRTDTKKQDGYKKDGYKKDGFKKDTVKKEGFKKDDTKKSFSGAKDGVRKKKSI